MPANVGSQNVTLLYRTAANSGEVNRRFVGIRQKGIYSGGRLSIVDSSNVQLSPLICEIGDDTYQVRVETTVAVNITVASATPYVVLRWIYTGAVTDYMEIKAVATPQPNDLIVGKCTFTGGGTLNGFDYGDDDYPRSTPNTQDLFLKVEPTEDTELRVRIRAGRVQVGGQTHDIPDQKSDLFTPPASNSRVYLVYIQLSDGTVQIDSSGTAAASPSAPSYKGKLVLAEVTLASTDTNITVDKIKDVRPFISVGYRDVDGVTIEVNNDGKLKTIDSIYLVMQDDNIQASSQSSWTKLTFDNVVKQSGISQVAGVVTLPSGKLYVISYVVNFVQIAYTPTCQVRLRVLSGDISWGFKDDSDNVSWQDIELGDSAAIEEASLSGTFIILPSSNTTIQLEVITKDGSQTGKVARCSLSVWRN